MLSIFALVARIFSKKEEKTWFSRTTLVKSGVIGMLAGAIVWGGLSGALGSIEALFDIDVSRKWYEAL